MDIDLGRHSVPDATTLMGFRHLLETHDLTQALLVEINAMLKERGLLMSRGTLVDATLIAAPSSTKNKEHERDPEMHQTQMGNQWYFGMKAHIGADKDSGLVHTVTGTAANISDISQTQNLLHGRESEVWADAGYAGVDKREDVKQVLAAMFYIGAHPFAQQVCVDSVPQRCARYRCAGMKVRFHQFALGLRVIPAPPVTSVSDYQPLG